jgi:hypothetical protein
MKKVILLATAFICFLTGGCSTLDSNIEEAPNDADGSGIIVRATSVEMAANNTFESDELGQVVFTGNDILWFNEITKELRFKDNYSYRLKILNNLAISFFIEDEYLFSSMVYMSSRGEQLINSLVLYYNQVENKYFLLDGYPDLSVFPEYQAPTGLNGDVNSKQYAKDLRNENAQTIASGWDKFINQLKKEGLLK